MLLKKTKTRIHKLFLILLATFSSIAISEFDINNFNKANAFELGQNLMKMPNGLHQVNNSDGSAKNLIIGIHGSNSEGYEWVYPLWKLNDDFTEIYFYRWNDGQCANKDNYILINSLAKALKDNPNIQNIKVLAHSYGGLYLLHSLALIEEFLETQIRPLKTEIHFIASLLSPPKLISLGCNMDDNFKDAYSMTIYNWKTIQSLDGAFRNYAKDPQDLKAPFNIETRLPSSYNGRKLGHNWSISWVADQIFKE
tara:strand:+ start:154 stop:912 length:759 start_codon:yes stop_codon:yes gene_type:complete